MASQAVKEKLQQMATKTTVQRFVKRQSRTAMSESAKKQKLAATDRTKIRLLRQFDRWCELKNSLALKSHEDTAAFLLDSYFASKMEASPSPLKPGDIHVRLSPSHFEPVAGPVRIPSTPAARRHANGTMWLSEISAPGSDRYHSSNHSRSENCGAEQDTASSTETNSEEENPIVKCEPLSPDAGFESQDVDVRLDSPQAVDVKLECIDPASMVKLEERVVHHSDGQLMEDERIPLTIPLNDNWEQESHPKNRQLCMSCGASLPQFDLLAEINHKGKKLHVCEQCGSAFAIYSNMVHHLMMRLHIGCKPIRCQSCGQCFQKRLLPHL